MTLAPGVWGWSPRNLTTTIDIDDLGPFFYKFARGMGKAAEQAGIPHEDILPEEIGIRMHPSDYRKLFDEFDQACDPPGTVPFDVFRANDKNVELDDTMPEGQVEFEFKGHK